MNFTRVRTTTQMFLKGFFRVKAALFFTFMFPILLMTLFGFIFQDFGQSTYDIHIMDLDGTPLSQNLTDVIGTLEGIDVQTVGSVEDINGYMKDNQIVFLIVIPQGYGASIIESQTDLNVSVNLTVKYDPTDSTNGVRLSLLSSVIGGLNDSQDTARELVDLVGKRLVFVNLIPWNPIPGRDWKSTSGGAARRFLAVLEAAGVPAAIRTPRGRDIAAACGQLRLSREGIGDASPAASANPDPVSA